MDELEEQIYNIASSRFVDFDETTESDLLATKLMGIVATETLKIEQMKGAINKFQKQTQKEVRHV